MRHPLFKDIEVTFERGQGAYLFDSRGNRYFDGISTLWTNLIGHGREEIVDAVADQLRKLSFMHLFTGAQHGPAQELSQRLTKGSPFGHAQCFFGLSGSDATETAMKMARAYWSNQGRSEKKIIIGRLSEYHGTSFGALSLMGWDSFQVPYTPLVAKTHRLPPPNCYHCPWEKDPATCQVFCKNSFEEYFAGVDARKNVAAILIEPIITSDGLIIPPQGYWEQIQNVCDANEVLIIADEVSTGMGRTGRLFASSHYGLKPDIVYLAKALTNGYVPLSAVLATQEIFEGIHANGNYFSHGSTFAGHPAACVAALKVLDILDHEQLMPRAEEIEKIVLAELRAQLAEVDVVGNIQGKGILFEVELVADRTTKKPPKNEIEIAMRLYLECLRNGQYLRPLGRFVCISPPLISREADLREMVTGLKKALLKVREARELWS